MKIKKVRAQSKWRCIRGTAQLSFWRRKYAQGSVHMLAFGAESPLPKERTGAGPSFDFQLRQV